MGGSLVGLEKKDEIKGTGAVLKALKKSQLQPFGYVMLGKPVVIYLHRQPISPKDFFELGMAILNNKKWGKEAYNLNNLDSFRMLLAHQMFADAARLGHPSAGEITLIEKNLAAVLTISNEIDQLEDWLYQGKQELSEFKFVPYMSKSNQKNLATELKINNLIYQSVSDFIAKYEVLAANSKKNPALIPDLVRLLSVHAREIQIAKDVLVQFATQAKHAYPNYQKLIEKSKYLEDVLSIMKDLENALIALNKLNSRVMPRVSPEPESKALGVDLSIPPELQKIGRLSLQQSPEGSAAEMSLPLRPAIEGVSPRLRGDPVSLSDIQLFAVPSGDSKVNPARVTEAPTAMAGPISVSELEPNPSAHSVKDAKRRVRFLSRQSSFDKLSQVHDVAAHPKQLEEFSPPKPPAYNASEKTRNRFLSRSSSLAQLPQVPGGVPAERVKLDKEQKRACP